MKRFSYFKTSYNILLSISTIFFLFLSVVFGFILKSESLKIYQYFFIFLGIMLCVVVSFAALNKIFFTRIIFSETEITYKGLFWSYTFKNEEILDVLIAKVEGKYNPIEYFHLTQRFEPQFIRGVHYVVIRKNEEWPSNRYSFFFNAANDDYITLQYRAEIKELINKNNKPLSIL